jgi:hypothetical protein
MKKLLMSLGAGVLLAGSAAVPFIFMAKGGAEENFNKPYEIVDAYLDASGEDLYLNIDVEGTSNEETGQVD